MTVRERSAPAAASTSRISNGALSFLPGWMMRGAPVCGGRGRGGEYQGHSHQVWSGQVCSVCMHKYTTARGGLGAYPSTPQKFF